MELKEQIEKLHSTFDAFKKANDARLDEISKKGSASAAAEEKVNKIEAEMQKIEKTIESLSATLNRTGGVQETDEQKAKKVEKAVKKEFGAFLRKGLGGEKGNGGDSFLATKAYQEWLEAKDMSVDSDIDGGFLVIPEISNTITLKVFESSPVRQLASVDTISSDSMDFYEDLDEVGDEWVGETQARGTNSSPQIQKVNIPVHEQKSMPKVTQKILDDARWNLEAWLAGKVSAKFARSEATAFISGNGVNKPKGILDYAPGTTFGKVERVAAANATSIVGDDLIGLQTSLKEPYQLNASWLINRSVIGAIRKLKGAVNQDYLWQPGLMSGVPPMLLGRPVYMAADLPSSFVTATDTIIYGDVREGYQILDRSGIRVLRDPYTVKGFVLFYTTKRVGGGMKNFEALKVLRMA